MTGRAEVRRFLGAVGEIPGKRAAAAAAWAATEGRGNPNIDIVPITLAEVANRVPMHRRRGLLRRLRWPSMQYPSRKRLARIAALSGDAYLAALANPDLRWDTITMIESLGTEPVYDMEVPGLHSFVADNVLVHNSFLTSMAFCYMVYWTLNLRDPQTYFGLAPGSHIVWLNQSINESQARRVVFHEVRERIIQAPWFRTHGYMPNPRVKSELLFPKGIVIFPGNSSLTFPAGYNVLGGVIDEAAWFTEPIPGSEREDPASAIYDSILRRIKSRFGNRSGLLLAISNPRHEDDFIERSYRFARFGDPERGIPPPPRTYASYAALWHSKPGPQRDDATGKWVPWRFVMFRQIAHDGSVAFSMDIPDVFLDDFRKNPEKAKRDLAAIASKKGVGYFWDPDIVWRARMTPDQPGFDPSMKHPLDAHGHFFEWFRWPLDRPGVCHAHVDLALTRDRAGLAVGHIGGVRDVAGEKRPVIDLDLMLEIAAPHGGQIDFQHVRNVLYTMIGRGFPIKYVTFDGWQCLAEGTLIACLDGKDRPIETLTKPTWVYAWDGKDLVPSLARPTRQTGEKVPVLRVTLDNGEAIRVTANHPFLLRSGEYRRADMLVPEDSLMPLNRRIIWSVAALADPAKRVRMAEGRWGRRVRANHRVVSVKPDGTADVYDIEVPGTHCFALAAGVLVHNSVDSIQQLNKRGIEAEVMSVDRDTAAYDTFYDAAHEARLNYYAYLPMYECVKSLVLVRGRKVDHTIDGKKDVTDAVAGVCQTLTERWLVGVIPAAGTTPTPVSASLRRGRVVGRPSGRRAVVT